MHVMWHNKGDTANITTNKQLERQNRTLWNSGQHTSRCGLDKVTPNVCRQVQWGSSFSKLIHWEQVISPISKTFRHPVFIIRVTCETISSVMMWWPKTSNHSVPYHCIQLTATATTKHYTLLANIHVNIIKRWKHSHVTIYKHFMKHIKMTSNETLYTTGSLYRYIHLYVTHTHIHAHKHTHTCTHACTHARTHAHTHTHTLVQIILSHGLYTLSS